MHIEYPPDLIFPGDDVPGVIRLSTASVLLAFENELEGLPSIESEDMPLADLKTHAFCNAPLSGNLLRRAETFRKALTDSVLQKELMPVSSRRSLSGVLDAVRTWLLVDDLHDWCEVREVRVGDWYNQYLDDETSIFYAAIEAADGARRQLEDPRGEEMIRERALALSGDSQEHAAAALDIIRENERLRAIVHSRKASEEKPLGIRERATLLNVIAALLQYSGDKEAAIIEEVLARNPGVSGLTKRTLEAKFAEAKRSIATL